MDFSLPYFVYCENASWVFSQPLNILSILSYLGVAVWLLFRAKQEDAELFQVTAVLLLLVGLSGIFWHSMETGLGLSFDVISALLLVAMLSTVMCSRLLEWPLWGCAGAVIVMLVFCIFLKDAGIPYLTQNGGAFLPPLLFVAFVALRLQQKNQDAMIYLLCSGYALFFGVFCRSIDMAVCDGFPTGTHFLSHVFGAISVIYVIKALDAARPKEEIEEKKNKSVLESDPI